MQKVTTVCSVVIVKTPERISPCTYNQKNKIIRNRDFMLMEYSVNVENDLEMRPNGRNKPFMVIVVDESSKSPLFHESEGIDKLEE